MKFKVFLLKLKKSFRRNLNTFQDCDDFRRNFQRKFADFSRAFEFLDLSMNRRDKDKYINIFFFEKNEQGHIISRIDREICFIWMCVLFETNRKLFKHRYIGLSKQLWCAFHSILYNDKRFSFFLLIC